MTQGRERGGGAWGGGAGGGGTGGLTETCSSRPGEGEVSGGEWASFCLGREAGWKGHYPSLGTQNRVVWGRGRVGSHFSLSRLGSEMAHLVGW